MKCKKSGGRVAGTPNKATAEVRALAGQYKAEAIGKTTACLHKVRKSCHRFPGIWWYIGRFSDGEVSSVLCPAWETCCQRVGEMPTWNAEERYYEFANKSRVFAFGLKSPDSLSRYAKLRGLEVSGMYIDQAEEFLRAGPETCQAPLEGHKRRNS